MMKIKSIFLSWDFIISIITFIVAMTMLPQKIYSTTALGIYSVGVTTISLIFSIYFASIAFIFASGDEEFIRFLEENDSYTQLVSTYKYTLFILFITLIISLILLVLNNFIDAKIVAPINSKYIFALYFSISVYSLICVFNSALDSLNYAKYRVKHYFNK